MRRLVSLLAVIVVQINLVAATDRYVRKDGNNACTGLEDAAWVSPCASNCPCAKPSIASIKDNVVSGDTLWIRGGGGAYEEQITWTAGFDEETTIKGYGPEKPVIGRIQTFNEDPNWVRHDPNSSMHVYKRDWQFGELTTAYLVPTAVYENGRVGLVLYESWNWLTAAPLASNADANALYYIGPGVWVDESAEKLFIRLDEDTDPNSGVGGALYDYQQKYINLGIGTDTGKSQDPGDFVIKVSSDDFTFRVNGHHYTFDNLSIEGTVEFCADGEDVHDISLTNNAIWASKRGAIRTYSDDDPDPPVSCASSDILIRNNYVLWDIPYWVSWMDAKADPNGDGRLPAYDHSRNSLINMNDFATEWTIERNLIRGGHDGIASNGFAAVDDPDIGGETDKIIVRYNRIEHFHDDPIEIEGDSVGRWDVYGNMISNSLNCLSSGQDTAVFTGPVYYFSNLCTLLRVPFISRSGQTAAWNGGLAYGNASAFKVEDSDSDNPVHMYNNTTILVDSHPGRGIGFISEDGQSAGMEFFNNVFMKINGRVGQEDYPDDTNPGDTNKPATVNWNLYRSLNNSDPNAPLLDSHTTTSDCFDDESGCGWEEDGLGASTSVGSDPQLLEQWGWGCMDPDVAQCNGFNKSDSDRWAVKPGSQWVDPSALIPNGNSVLCNVGRPSMPGPTDPNHPAYFPRNPPTPSGSVFDVTDIGSLACGTAASAFDYFPMNAGWKTTQLVTGQAPQVTMTDPSPSTECPVTITNGDYVHFCATFDSDADGGVPMKVLWQFQGSNCPADRTEACPGDIQITSGTGCTAVFSVTDRWGLKETPSPSCQINVSGGGGSCSECWRCICEEW